MFRTVSILLGKKTVGNGRNIPSALPEKVIFFQITCRNQKSSTATEKNSTSRVSLKKASKLGFGRIVSSKNRHFLVSNASSRMNSEEKSVESLKNADSSLEIEEKNQPSLVEEKPFASSSSQQQQQDFDEPPPKKFRGFQASEVAKKIKFGVISKEKQSSLPPARIFLQVVQSGCRGVGKCVMLWTDTTSYLFNCPEGVQRMSAEHKIQAKLEHVFFTQSTWLNSGGLPGMTLSLDKGGVEKLTVHGPPHLKQIFMGIRPFAEDTTDIEIVERHHDEVAFEDSAMTVEYVPLISDQERESDSDDEKESSLNSQLPGDGPDFIQTVKHCMKDSVKYLSVAYICRLKPRPGSLNIVKCAELGVPKGPLLGELQRGNCVTLQNGTIVIPDQVMEKSQRGPVFIVVECPNESFLDSLINCEQFNKILQDKETVLDLIIHMSDAAVYRKTKYHQWMRSFGPDTKHLVLNDFSPYLPHSEGIFRSQGLLNFIHPKIFPKLQKYEHVSADLPPLDNVGGSIVCAEPFLKFFLRPLNGFERDTDFVFNTKADIETALKENRHFGSERDKFRERINLTSEIPVKTKRNLPEIVFFGTGSSTPSKYRNVAGILLNLTSETSVLLDCGESTYYQMFHLLGPDETNKILVNLKLAFVSHLHQDHHLGLFTLLRKRKEAFDQMGREFEPCCLLAAGPLFSMHHMYSRLIEKVGIFSDRISTKLGEGQKKELRELVNRMGGVREVSVVKVNHPKMAAGIVLVTQDWKKIVYSGDTRPCSELIRAGKGADLLIHEATFDDSLKEDAVKKRHSTTGEAIDVGRQMGAKFILLTHFSSRYAKLPLISEKFDERVGVAFDNMRISFDELHVLPKMLPVLKELFWEQYLDMEKKLERDKNRRMLQAREEKMTEINAGFATAL